MKFLIVNTDYLDFLRQLYAQHPGLEERTYSEQMRTRMGTFFGVADFYSHALRELGHAAEDIHANNEPMQRAWARENGLKLRAAGQRWKFRLRRGVVPWLTRKPDLRWFSEVLVAQVKHHQPDVLLNQAMINLPGEIIRRLKPHVRLLVGQHASPLPPPEACRGHDLVLSSLPNQVAHFRGLGLQAELWRLGFDARVLTAIGPAGPRIPVSFVGSLGINHRSRLRLLERLCERTNIQIWGLGAGDLPPGHPVLERHRGLAWGLDMYRLLHDSSITINQHLDVATDYANNLRLYEATGVGSFLLTDWKENLHEMFEPEKEVATYRTAEECMEKIAHYLAHSEERESIARAGQERTLQGHTYSHRMQELLDLLGKRL